MGLFIFPVGDPAEVDIAPGSLEKPAADAHAAKLQRAIALLGDKWCLADTRKEQIEKLKSEGWDLRMTKQQHATKDELPAGGATARIDLSMFVNAADISAANVPHIVVEKLQRAIDATNVSLVSATTRLPEGMVLVERDDLETLQLIAASALKTFSRDLQDWIQDMERVKAKAETWLAADPSQAEQPGAREEHNAVCPPCRKTWAANFRYEWPKCPACGIPAEQTRRTSDR